MLHVILFYFFHHLHLSITSRASSQGSFSSWPNTNRIVCVGALFLICECIPESAGCGWPHPSSHCSFKPHYCFGPNLIWPQSKRPPLHTHRSTIKKKRKKSWAVWRAAAAARVKLRGLASDWWWLWWGVAVFTLISHPAGATAGHSTGGSGREEENRVREAEC